MHTLTEFRRQLLEGWSDVDRERYGRRANYLEEHEGLAWQAAEAKAFNDISALMAREKWDREHRPKPTIQGRFI